MSEASKLPPEPWRFDYENRPELHSIPVGVLRDAEGGLQAVIFYPEWPEHQALAALLLAAPTTARRLERIERAARELLFAYDVGYPATEIFKLFEALRAALEEKQ
jgi:hypothetical protein